MSFREGQANTLSLKEYFRYATQELKGKLVLVVRKHGVHIAKELLRMEEEGLITIRRIVM